MIFNFPNSKSGNTLSLSCEAISPFCSIVRGRNVDPVTVNRFNITGIKLISLTDDWTPIADDGAWNTDHCAKIMIIGAH